MALYELAVLGGPTQGQIDELTEFVSQAVAYFGWELGKDVGWSVLPTEFKPPQSGGFAAVFYGAPALLDWHPSADFPIVPVVSDAEQVNAEIPEALRSLNCISLSDNGVPRIASALFESAGILPRQRQIFISYRQREARDAALQLFDALSALKYKVFLDTHAIPFAVDFAESLWHELCDTDIVVMLDTVSYFESDWTKLELHWANRKGIPVLRVVWPGILLHPQAHGSEPVELAEGDIVTGCLSTDSVKTICQHLENLRCKGHGVRTLSLYRRLQTAVEEVGGKFEGLGPHKTALIRLSNGKNITVHPALCVPTATLLHAAAIATPKQCPTVLYDHLGLKPSCLEHIDWLGSQIKEARWLKLETAVEQLNAWEACHHD